ncbi:MAG: hypothetical protein ACR2PH_11025 [Desulfobulbia bacterium]
MPTTRKPRHKNAQSVTLYLGNEVVDKIDFFAEKTVRTKSQAAEYLIRMGLERFIETKAEEPADAPKLTPARKKKPVSMEQAELPLDEPQRRNAKVTSIEKPKARAKRKPRAKAAS